jgi:hypothetical protein
MEKVASPKNHKIKSKIQKLKIKKNTEVSSFSSVPHMAPSTPLCTILSA